MNLDLQTLKELSSVDLMKESLVLANLRLSNDEPVTDDAFHAAVERLIVSNDVARIANKDTGDRLTLTNRGKARMARAGL